MDIHEIINRIYRMPEASADKVVKHLSKSHKRLDVGGVRFGHFCGADLDPGQGRHHRGRVQSRYGAAHRRGAHHGVGHGVCAEQAGPGEGGAQNELGFICLSGLATGASWLCYYKALQDGLASVVVPIDKLSILVTIAFSYLVFHEKLTKRAALGLVLIVAGTLLMIL